MIKITFIFIIGIQNLRWHSVFQTFGENENLKKQNLLQKIRKNVVDECIVKMTMKFFLSVQISKCVWMKKN